MFVGELVNGDDDYVVPRAAYTMAVSDCLIFL